MHGIDSLKAQFRERTGYALDLDNPRTYCEKVQWRKVYDRRPMLPRLADKITAQQVVGIYLDPKYLVPSIYSRYGTPTLPEIGRFMTDDCVIKAAHGCAWMIFQGAQGKYMNAKMVKREISQWLASTYGQDKLQWAEGQINPGVLVEQYMTYRGGQPPLVKLYVFDGVAKMGNLIEHGKHTVVTRAKPATDTWYDRDGNRLDLRLGHIPATDKPAPAEYSQCVELSERLGAGIDHVRVDWLLTDEGMKFSEFEWYPTSGMFRLEPPEWDRIMGDWWTLPKEAA